MTGEIVTLAEAHPGDIPAFKKELQDAFAEAVIEEFGALAGRADPFRPGPWTRRSRRPAPRFCASCPAAARSAAPW
ncbi:hypothetical protein ACIKTA_03650 [Hansschlegelia beijingensis]